MNMTQAFESLQSRVLANLAPSISLRTLEIGGPVERVQILEGGRGAPLLLLHGGGGMSAVWAPILEALARRYHVVAVDRPGCGLSDRIDYRQVDDYRGHAVTFVEHVADALHWRRCAILANSMGAYWATEFALAHPSRVEKLVLAGAPAGADKSLPVPLRLLGVRAINALMQRTVESPKGIRRLFKQVLVSHPERVTDDLYELSRLNFVMPGGRLAWLSMLEVFTTLGGVDARWYNRDRLLALDMPTLFLWGQDDAFAPPSSGADLARRMPNAKLQILAHAGHLPWLDEPSLVAAGVSEWLG